MFYCDDCAKRLDWPDKTPLRSEGPCECCGRVALCNDFPSRLLPLPQAPVQRSAGQRVGKWVKLLLGGGWRA